MDGKLQIYLLSAILLFYVLQKICLNKFSHFLRFVNNNSLRTLKKIGPYTNQITAHAMLMLSPGHNGSKSWVVQSEKQNYAGCWVKLSRVEELNSETDGQTGMAV